MQMNESHPNFSEDMELLCSIPPDGALERDIRADFDASWRWTETRIKSIKDTLRVRLRVIKRHTGEQNRRQNWITWNSASDRMAGECLAEAYWDKVYGGGV